VRIAVRLSEIVLASLIVGGFGGSAERAHADPAPDPQIEKADALFAEGKALVDSNLLQACTKFEESLHLNPAAIGTLLNVALCDEKLGRIASAIVKFSEARDRAKEQGLPEHIRAAEEHILALEPSVPHVAITLTEQLPETKILIDDAIIALDAIANVAVDPGERVIVVSAPARLPYRAKLVFARGEHKDLTIPALAESVTVRSSQRRIGQIATGVGATAAGAGLGFGLYALHLYNKQFDDGRCRHVAGTGDLCQPNGQSRTERARSLGNVGTVLGIAGVVVTGVGAFLWYGAPASTSNDPGDKKVSVVPSIGPDGLGIVALGRF
jgi:hypothetical protein